MGAPPAARMSSTPAVVTAPGTGGRPAGEQELQSNVDIDSSQNSLEFGEAMVNNKSINSNLFALDLACEEDGSRVENYFCQMCISSDSTLSSSRDIVVPAGQLCSHGLQPRVRGKQQNHTELPPLLTEEEELPPYGDSVKRLAHLHTALIRRSGTSGHVGLGKQGRLTRKLPRVKQMSNIHRGDDTESERLWASDLPMDQREMSSDDDMRCSREVMASRGLHLNYPARHRAQWGLWLRLALMELQQPVGRAAFLRSPTETPGTWLVSAMGRLRRRTRKEWRDCLAIDGETALGPFLSLGLRCAETRYGLQRVQATKRKPNPVEWASSLVDEVFVSDDGGEVSQHRVTSPPLAERKGHENIITACRRQELARRASALAHGCILGIRTEGDIRICTININGLWADKFMQLISFMKEYAIDVLICIDTRISLLAAKSFGQVAKEALGQGTFVGACDFGRARATRRRLSSQAAGGQLVVVSPKFGGAVRDFRQDWTGLGIASSFTLPCATGRLMVVGSYWPTPGRGAAHSNKLSDRLKQELANRGHQEAPLVMIKDLIGGWWDKHMSTSGNSFILAGDLNSGWGTATGTYAGLKKWADDLDLVNGPWELAADSGSHLYTRPPGPSNPNGSLVDHILLASPDQFIKTVGAWIPTGAIWEAISDHLPLVADFSIEGGRGLDSRVLAGTPIAMTPACDLDISDARACRRFHRILDKVAASETLTDLADSDPGAALEYISAISNQTSMKVQRKKRTKRGCRKDGWSPLFMAYKQHLLMLLEVRRHLWGQARRPKWGQGRECGADMLRLTQRWEDEVARVLWDSSISDAFNKENIQAVLNVTGMGPIQWRLFEGNKRTLVSCEIDRIRSLMQGRRRGEMRKSINENVRKREDLRAQGKIGKVIRSILGTQREFFAMDSVRDLTGDLLTDAVDIHATMTVHFTEAYAVLDEYKDLFLHSGREDWAGLFNSKQLFREKVVSMNKGIPPNMIDAIWEGLVDVPREEALRARMEEVLSSTPTRDEFGDSLRSIKRGSAAGMSGLSYNMISKWPERLIDVVYECLVKVWEFKSVPDFWKWKWLVPIPKDPENISLGTLRPIMLIETTRKLWGRLIMTKIQSVWTEMAALSSAQHGGLPGRGTDTANVQHINIMESAMATLAALHITSWDMQKAFDAVSRNAMVLGWERLGVPREIAEWIGGMDEGGRVVVRTPAAAAINKRKGRHGFVAADGELCRVAALCSEKGTPQGDVSSPMNWVAIFDILLRSLARARGGEFWVRGDEEGPYTAADQAYMDDLISSTGTHEALQTRADIVSAFCLIFGISLSEHKFRQLAINVPFDVPIVIRKEGWVDKALPAQTGAPIKVLGTYYDAQYSGKAELTRLCKMFSQHCSVTERRKASATTKIMVYQVSIIRRITYSAKFLPLSLKDFRKLGVIGDAFLRKVTKMMPTSPSILLYAPRSTCGGGILNIVDEIHKDKLGLMRRSLSGSEESRRTMTAMILRESLAREGALGQWTLVSLVHERLLCQLWWATSLVEWCLEAGVYLHRGGSSLSGTMEEEWRDIIPEWLDLLRKTGVRSIGDTVALTDQGYVWSLPAKLQDIPEVIARTSQACPNGSPQLALGQFYRNIGPTAEALEVVGWRRRDNVVMVEMAVWPIALTRRVRWLHSSPTRRLIPHDVLSASAWTRMLVSPLRAGKRGIISEQAARMGLMAAVSWPAPQWVREGGWLDPPARQLLFGDGSWKEEITDVAGALRLHSNGIQATGGLVMMADSLDWWKDVRILRVVGGADIGATSAYTMETLMATLSMILSRSRGQRELTASDCKAAVSTLSHAEEKGRKASATHMLLLDAAASADLAGAPVPRWVRSHPERRLVDKTLWTIDDWGIFIADYAAAGRWKELQDLHIHITIQNISAQEAYSSTVTAGQWYWGNQDGLPVEVLSLKDVVAKHRMPKYLDDRDDNRMGDGRPAYWRGIPLEHIALAFDIAKGTIGSIMRLIRIIFDKGWHGGNRRKGFPNGLEQDLAGRCEICLRQDSQYHWLSECCYPEATAIREKVIGLLGAAVSNHFRDNERNLGRVGEFIMTGLLRADAKRFWLGHWSDTMVASLDEYLSIWDFKPVDGADIRCALDDYAEILANGASLLWDSKLRESNHCRRSRIGPGWSTPEGPQPANDTLRQERARGSMSDSRGRQRPTATPGLRQLTLVELDVRNLSRRRDAESRRLQQECAASILDIPFRSRRLGDPGPRVDPQDTPFVVPLADEDTGADAEEILHKYCIVIWRGAKG